MASLAEVERKIINCNIHVFQPFTPYAIFRSCHQSYFIFRQQKFKKNLSKVLNTFENNMENGAFAPNEQMLHFL